MSVKMSDEEFLKIIRDKLAFLEEERYGTYKSMKRWRIIKYVVYLVFLAAAAGYGHYFINKHALDITNMTEDTQRIFVFMGIGFVTIAGFLQGTMVHFAERPKKNYKKNFKSLVLPQVAKILGDFDYKHHDRIDLQQIKQSKIIPPFKNIECSDVFRGAYKGVGVEFAELYLYNEVKNKKGRDLKVYKFKGLYVLLNIDHIKFKGHTVLNNDKDAFLGVYKDGIVGLKKARIADPEFEKVYDVLTNDQVEARYILDPVMIEKITKLYHESHGVGLKAAFYDSKLLIMIESNHDHFEAEGIETAIFDGQSLLQIKHDIDNITGIIDKLEIFNPDSVADKPTEVKQTEDVSEEKSVSDIDDDVSEHNYSF